MNKFLSAYLPIASLYETWMDGSIGLTGHLPIITSHTRTKQIRAQNLPQFPLDDLLEQLGEWWIHMELI